MDKVIESFILNAPMAAALAVMLKIVYDDAKSDREASRVERAATLTELATLREKVELLTQAITSLADNVRDGQPSLPIVKT